MILRRIIAALGIASPVFAQYAGPAILSRGDAPTAMANPQISFRPFIDLTGIYDTGLSGVSVNSQGILGNTNSPGVQLAGGLSGSHSWKHTQIGLSYRGDINRYTKATYYDRTDQSLLFSVRQQFTRHLYVELREAAGQYSRTTGLLGLPQTVQFDPGQLSIPTTDFFDNRIIYANTQADVILQKSARLSFDFGGGGFLNRYRSTALFGVTGFTARGDVQYRLTRRSTIGANYSYEQFDFTHIFSSTDLHLFAATYALELSRNVEFSGYAGASRVETKFIQNVPVDPAIAALIGISESPQVTFSVRYLPNVSLRLSKRFSTGIAHLSGGRTVTPGNGLFLTSVVTNISAGYTYTGLRRWSFNAAVGRNMGDSIGNVSGKYGDTSGTLSASRHIVKSLHVVAGFSARQYDSRTFSQYNRLIYEGRFGFGWAPGDVPLRIW